MAKLKLNFEGIESFQKCGEGEHVVKVIKADSTVAKSSGADMLSFQFEVTMGTSAGARLFDNFVLSEKALWKLKMFLETVGIPADGKLVLDTDKLKGRMCIASVNLEEYNGVERPVIKDYKKIEDTEEDPAVEEEDNTFDEDPAVEEDIVDEDPAVEEDTAVEDTEDDGPTIYELEDGTYELEDGTPCDENGNVIKKPVKSKKSKKEEKPKKEETDDWGTGSDDGDDW